MDFGKAFSFVFDDPDWLKKIAIAALVGLIPIVGQFVLIGWTLETTKRVIRQDPAPLADLDFGGQLSLGFQSFLVGLVYGIPAFIIYLPAFILPFVFGEGGNGEAANWFVMLGVFCCTGLMILYALLLVIFLPAAQGNFLAEGRMRAAFDFKKVFGLLRAAPGAYLLVLLGGLIAGFIAPLGGVACGVGALLTSAYAMQISAHLIGQAYHAAVTNGARV